jgi:hypothetical protein
VRLVGYLKRSLEIYKHGLTSLAFSLQVKHTPHFNALYVNLLLDFDFTSFTFLNDRQDNRALCFLVLVFQKIAILLSILNGYGQ